MLEFHKYKEISNRFESEIEKIIRSLRDKDKKRIKKALVNTFRDIGYEFYVGKELSKKEIKSIFLSYLYSQRFDIKFELNIVNQILREIFQYVLSDFPKEEKIRWIEIYLMKNYTQIDRS